MGVSLKIKTTVTNGKSNAAVTAEVYAVTNYGSYNNTKQTGSVNIGGKTFSFSSTYKANSSTRIAKETATFEKGKAQKTIKVTASFRTGLSSGTIKTSDTAKIPALKSYSIKYNGNVTIKQLLNRLIDGEKNEEILQDRDRLCLVRSEMRRYSEEGRRCHRRQRQLHDTEDEGGVRRRSRCGCRHEERLQGLQEGRGRLRDRIIIGMIEWH